VPDEERAFDEAVAPFRFHLPDELIARYPPEVRGTSRLLHVPLDGRPLGHHRFPDVLGQLRPGDRLVVNDTKVLAARVQARRSTGGKVELLLLEPGPGPVRALARPAKKLKQGDRLTLVAGGGATVVGEAEEGVVRVAFDADPLDVMEAQGALPIPPYLGRDEEAVDRERYQTVYATDPGSAAAPTAGLHLTDDLLAALQDRGIGLTRVTLHVGLGTFRPLRPEDLKRGRLHEERIIVSEQSAADLAETRRQGGRVVAVGTTSCRTLEGATPPGARSPEPCDTTTDLFIREGYRFRCVDGLITNFHLPGSSLIMLVAALAGRDRVLSAYETAVARGYRFYSYGDAMLLL
jgi:S-adenosylmethionine:tRNA ribosyltransferase-isomerase